MDEIDVWLFVHYDLFKDFAAPMATIIAAGAAVFFTWRLGRNQLAVAQQQAQLADVRLRHDLFDRRFKVYVAARTFIIQTEQNARISDDAFFSYVRDTLDAVFLFDQDVLDYLELIRKRASELRRAKIHVDQQREVGPEREKAVAAEMRVLEWFQAQYEILIATFSPSLSLRLGR
jgi:hypothetical protein